MLVAWFGGGLCSTLYWQLGVMVVVVDSVLYMLHGGMVVVARVARSICK